MIETRYKRWPSEEDKQPYPTSFELSSYLSLLNQLTPIGPFDSMLFFPILLPLLALVSATPFTKRYSGAKIQSYRDGKCLSPNSNDYSNGVQVVTVNCDQAKTWDINPGSGSVILHGTNFALDAGTGADNNEIVKVRPLPSP